MNLEISRTDESEKKPTHKCCTCLTETQSAQEKFKSKICWTYVVLWNIFVLITRTVVIWPYKVISIAYALTFQLKDKSNRLYCEKKCQWLLFSVWWPYRIFGTTHLDWRTERRRPNNMLRILNLDMIYREACDHKTQ